MTDKRSRRTPAASSMPVAGDEVPLTEPLYSRRDAGLIPLEDLALDLIRMFAADNIDAGKGIRNDAYSLSLHRLGARFGLDFANRVLGFVKAIRTERGGPFRFLPAGCCSISAHELAALGAVRAARMTCRHKGSIAFEQALDVLAAGREPARIAFAARSLAEASDLIERSALCGEQLEWRSITPASLTIH